MNQAQIIQAIVSLAVGFSGGFVARGVSRRKRKLAITLDFQEQCDHEFGASGVCGRCGSMHPGPGPRLQLQEDTPVDGRRRRSRNIVE